MRNFARKIGTENLFGLFGLAASALLIGGVGAQSYMCHGADALRDGLYSKILTELKSGAPSTGQSFTACNFYSCARVNTLSTTPWLKQEGCVDTRYSETILDGYIRPNYDYGFHDSPEICKSQKVPGEDFILG